MLPSLFKPMLAVAAPEPFDSDHYLFEIKWDGIRCLAFVENRQIRLQSRQLIDITAQFPELASASQLPDGTVLDGELVAMEGGRPSLAKVQGRALLQDRHRIELTSQSSPVMYVAFDLVYARGESIMAKPLWERRQELEQLLSDSQPKAVILSRAVLGQGSDLFQAVQKLGLEGTMAKSLDGHYRAGKRTAVWKKIKIKGYHRPAPGHPSTT
jgi:bifunctional non-homologous end joining protein LigD/DNA ligase-1